MTILFYRLSDIRNKQAELYEAIVTKKDNIKELLDKYEDIIDYNIQIGEHNILQIIMYMRLCDFYAFVQVTDNSRT